MIIFIVVLVIIFWCYVDKYTEHFEEKCPKIPKLACPECVVQDDVEPDCPDILDCPECEECPKLVCPECPTCLTKKDICPKCPDLSKCPKCKTVDDVIAVSGLTSNIKWHPISTLPHPNSGPPDLYKDEYIANLPACMIKCGADDKCKWFSYYPGKQYYDGTTGIQAPVYDQFGTVFPLKRRPSCGFWSKNNNPNSPYKPGFHSSGSVGWGMTYMKGVRCPAGYKPAKMHPYCCRGVCPEGQEWENYDDICTYDPNNPLDAKKYPLCGDLYTKL